MRRTGKTTRLVNDAIEHLFNSGIIIIPMTKPRLLKIDELIPTGNYVIDADSDINWLGVQQYLKNKILDRMKLEHSHIKLQIKKESIKII